MNGKSRWTYSDFNPRSREGSDLDVQEEIDKKLDISIHAPARGATIPINIKSRIICISIHAPARGATNLIDIIKTYAFYFNPRSREGSDKYIYEPSNLLGISIHAPARGATV